MAQVQRDCSAFIAWTGWTHAMTLECYFEDGCPNQKTNKNSSSSKNNNKISTWATLKIYTDWLFDWVTEMISDQQQTFFYSKQTVNYYCNIAASKLWLSFLLYHLENYHSVAITYRKHIGYDHIWDHTLHISPYTHTIYQLFLPNNASYRQ